MRYEMIQGIEKTVSKMFYGTAVGPMMEGANCDRLLDGVFELGINAFDTARVYGLAEKSLGSWMERRGNREKVMVLSKGGHPKTSDMSSRMTEREIRKDLGTSLEYMKTDYIDLYMLHRDDTNVAVGEIMEILNAFVKEGKVRAIGASNWSIRRIQEANAYAKEKGLQPFVCASPYFGLATEADDPWGGNTTSIAGKENEADRMWFEKSRMPVIAYSGLAHGLLSGKITDENWDRMEEILDRFAVKGYRSEENRERLRRLEMMAEMKGETIPCLALAWLLHTKVNAFPVVTTIKAERMRENVGALEITLTAEECAWLNLED